MPNIKRLGILALGAGCALVAVRLLSADQHTAAPRHDATPDSQVASPDEPPRRPTPVVARRRRASADDDVPESQPVTPPALSADVSATSGFAAVVESLHRDGIPQDETDAADRDPAKHARFEVIAVTFLTNQTACAHQLDLTHQRAADEWFRAHRSEYTPIEDEKNARAVQRSMVASRHIVTSDGSFYVDANDNPSETYRARRRELQQKLDDQLADVRAQLRLLAAE